MAGREGCRNGGGNFPSIFVSTTGGVTNGSLKMTPEDDSDSLLTQFLTDRSERAFRGLVQRHLPLVHAVAFRSLRDAELAKEVSQQVFIRLAARAHGIRQECGLVAWLHRTAHSLAVDTVRREQRRKLREQKAAAMSAPSSSPEVAWESLAPVLDDLLNRLPEDDRHVILLRYYENRPLASVAASLGIQEKAAAKRAIRSLDRLRALFAKRGIATTTSALAGILPLHAAPSAPAGLAAVISASSFSAAPASLFTWFAMTTTTKLSLGSAAILSLVWLYFGSSQSALNRAREASSGVTDHPAFAASSMSTVRPARPGPSSVGQLEEAAKVSNLFERRRALEAVLSSLPKVDFPDAARKLTALGFDAFTPEIKLLVSHWSALDPSGVYAFSVAKDGVPGLLPSAIEEWGKQDFDAAFAKAVDLPDSSLRRQVLERSLLLPLAVDDPPRAFVSMGRCLPDLRWDTLPLLAVEILQKRPGSLRQMAAEIPPEVNRNDLLICFVAGVSMRGGGSQHRDHHSPGVPYSSSQSRIALADQAFSAEWIAENPDTARSRMDLDCGNLFNALALADRNLAAGIAAKIPAEAGSLRDIVSEALEAADRSLGSSPAASDDPAPGKP